MADLPDLVTTEISFIAFWNAIDDGGVTSIDPEDCLSQNNIDSYTLYDNGWEGQYQLTTGRKATVRVKSDGWFIAYLDRTENYNQTQSDPDQIRGPWDILHNWTSQGTVADLKDNTLEQAINNLAQELDNWGDVSYATVNVGLYDYKYSSAEEYVLFSHNVNDGSTNRGFLHSSKTVHQCSVCSTVDLAAGSSGRAGDVIFDPDDLNLTIVDYNGEDRRHGTRNLTTEIQDDETEYKTYLRATAYYSGANAHASFLIWSSDAA